jgi:hypothetical protein
MRKQSGEKVKEKQVYELPNHLGHAIHRPGFIYRDKAQKKPGCCPYR